MFSCPTLLRISIAYDSRKPLPVYLSADVAKEPDSLALTRLPDTRLRRMRRDVIDLFLFVNRCKYLYNLALSWFLWRCKIRRANAQPHHLWRQQGSAYLRAKRVQQPVSFALSLDVHHGWKWQLGIGDVTELCEVCLGLCTGIAASASMPFWTPSDHQPRRFFDDVGSSSVHQLIQKFSLELFYEEHRMTQIP